MPPAKPSLVGLTRAALAEALGAIGVAPAQQKMRVQQLWHWIYVRGAQSFDQMTSVSKELHARARRALHAGAARGRRRAGFGRRHAQVAAAAARARSRASGRTRSSASTSRRPIAARLCVSSQVGCTLTCSFCHTGTQRLVRNLTPGEIVGQVMVARDRLGDFLGMERAQGAGVPTGGDRCISNIVMMGMGEPLYNFEAVRDALAVVQDGDGLAISRRRITLSTSGVVPMIERAGAEIGVMLAISLHAVRDELRDKLVPLNRKYPIARIARGLPQLSRRCRTRGASPSNTSCSRASTIRSRTPRRWSACSRASRPRSISFRSIPGPAASTNARTGTRSRNSPRSCSTPATPRRCARRAAATSSPPAASSRARPRSFRARERLALRAMAMTD